MRMKNRASGIFQKPLGGRGGECIIRRDRMTAKQKHLFYTELAKLLAAGFGIRQAAKKLLMR